MLMQRPSYCRSFAYLGLELFDQSFNEVGLADSTTGQSQKVGINAR